VLANVMRGPIGGGVVNALAQVLPPHVYLRLRFRDPDGVVRDFPLGFPVRVRSGAGVVETFDTAVQAGGQVTFAAPLSPPWRSFTLDFRSAEVPYVVCEPAVSPPSQPRLHTPGELAAATRNGQRFFSLPLQWEVRQADWSPPPVFAGNGSFSPPQGTIRHTLAPFQDIASQPAPAVLLLEPHWHYARFEYFDRYYGRQHASRVNIPPVTLEGFRASPPAADPDTRSNWTTGADPKRLQCLPWVLRRQADGTPLPALNREMTLQFRTTPPTRYVHSRSAAQRVLVGLDPVGDADTLKPGPERLRYYDLPALWKSKRYYTRFSPPGGEFFHALSEAQIGRASRPDSPLIFSLDDLVMTDAALGPLDARGRPIVFDHRFLTTVSPPVLAAPPLLDPQAVQLFRGLGVHKPGSEISPPGYPYSDVPLFVRSYVHDYPDWTRLVVADGNLFDAFDRRTPDGIGRVVGARAAVRWINATSPPNGEVPGNALDPRPGLFERPFFALQSFYRQDYLIPFEGHNPEVGPVLHDEWAAAYPNTYDRIGRFDIAHLRCCGVDGGREVSLLLRFSRFVFDFSSNHPTTGAGNPYSPPRWVSPPPYNSVEWTRRFVTGVTARWNGFDAHNSDRAWIVPRPSPPRPLSPPLKTQVLTLIQYLAEPHAHLKVVTVRPTAGSSMNVDNGRGRLRANAVDHDSGPPPAKDAWGADRWAEGRGMAAAHEAGHCGSMPDEYRSDTDESKNFLSLNLLGNPYILDPKGLMNTNWHIRSRYFWHAVEWMRTLTGLNGAKLKIEHGAGEADYYLPHYRHAAHPARNFVNWPVRFNLRQRPPGGGNTCFDSVLYLLGKDRYSTEILPRMIGLAVGAANAVDAILVVMLRIRMDFNAVVAPDVDEVRDRVCLRIEQLFDARLNSDGNRRYASFRLTGSPPLPRVQRCVLHFVPCFLTDTGAGYEQQGFDFGPDQDLHTFSPEHLFVDIDDTYTNTRTDAAPPNFKRLRLRCPADMGALPALNYQASINAMGDRVFDAACWTMGLENDPDPAVAGSYASPPSYVNIVQTVANNALSPPILR